MPDWSTIASLGTAAATLLLAVATFMSVRSANRAARAAERSLLAGLRPLLLPSELTDPEQKVGFIDQKWFHLPGGCAIAEVDDDAIYLAISVRNAASGIAVLHGWRFHPRRVVTEDRPRPDDFHQLTRDLYVPAGSYGFWQGTYRDPHEAEFEAAARVITQRDPVTVDILYGDNDGGQRVITRFNLTARGDGTWFTAVSRHWNLDRPDPR